MAWKKLRDTVWSASKNVQKTSFPYIEIFGNRNYEVVLINRFDEKLLGEKLTKKQAIDLVKKYVRSHPNG